MGTANANEFMGLSKKSAQDKAEKKNMVFRLIRIDGEMFFAYPDDHMNERVCVEIDAGKVTKASIR